MIDVAIGTLNDRPRTMTHYVPMAEQILAFMLQHYVPRADIT